MKLSRSLILKYYLQKTSNDGTAKIWHVFEKQELIDYARAHVPRQLTPEQRKQFFLE